jgi:hypothetical protein
MFRDQRSIPLRPVGVGRSSLTRRNNRAGRIAEHNQAYVGQLAVKMLHHVSRKPLQRCETLAGSGYLSVGCSSWWR